jgi:predicted hydrocarbon binding protein
MIYMMNSQCSIKPAENNQSRIISIDDCIVCKEIKSTTPACSIIVGFLKELTRMFANVAKNANLKVEAQEIECHALGNKQCKIKLRWM